MKIVPRIDTTSEYAGYHDMISGVYFGQKNKLQNKNAPHRITKKM